MERDGHEWSEKERTITRATVDGQRRQFDGRRLRPRGALFWWRWPTLPHKRLPRAAEYCIGCLKGLLQRRESVLQREKERGRYERRWLQEEGEGRGERESERENERE